MEFTSNHRGEIRSEIAATLGTDPNHLPALLTTQQAAHVLGVKPATLQNWRSLGRHDLPFVRVGRLPRYRTSDLADWIAGRTAGKG